MGSRWSGRSAILLLSLLLSVAGLCSGGVTSSYRRKLYGSDGLPISDFPPPPGYNAPEQVHITQGDYEGRGVIISWVNPNERDPSYVTYWKADGEGKKHKIQKHKKHAETKTYKYFNYKSGFIHHATIENLEYDTKYIYELGKGQSARQFSFATPPEPGPDVPYTFGLMGDLGQTADSNQTLEHYINNPKKAQALLFAGDLSYADHYPNHDNRRWDTWGRFVEKSNAYQPWIWASGNHELDLDQNIGEMQPFKPYLNRYHVPYKAAGSESPLWYSFRRGPAHIIVLCSYSSAAKYTLQHTWFWNELKNKVNWTITPWVIVVLHTPWYNSNGYHYMEGENMRVVFEPWVVDSKVDLIIAGHVHSYERSYRVC